MTFIEDTLIPIACFQVGSGTVHPVLAIPRMFERLLAVDGASSPSRREVQWSFISLAVAASRNDRNASRAAIRSDIVKRGLQVQYWDSEDDPIVLPAQGGASGSVRGFPRVEVTFLDEWNGWLSCDKFLLMQVTINSEIPVAYTTTNGYHIAESWQRVETSNDRNNNETQRVTGFVRTAANENAGTYVADYIIATARSAAVSNELDMVDRRTVEIDQSQCNYEYTLSPRGSNSWSFGDVTVANVSDVTTQRNDGMARRVVSGYAEGIGATAFAESLEPEAGTNEILVSKRVSVPSQPDGRVTFEYEIQRGVTVAGFEGLAIFSIRETVSEAPGNPLIQTAEFPEGSPLLWLSGPRVWRYIISTQIEFAGEWNLVAINPPGDWADYRDGGIAPQFGPEETGIRTVSTVQRFTFPTRPTLPAPRRIPPL